MKALKECANPLASCYNKNNCNPITTPNTGSSTTGGGGGGLCFPGSASVRTPQGHKFMHSLSIGEQILSVTPDGSTDYSEVSKLTY
jgi:hypothetical protein